MVFDEIGKKKDKQIGIIVIGWLVHNLFDIYVPYHIPSYRYNLILVSSYDIEVYKKKSKRCSILFISFFLY